MGDDPKFVVIAVIVVKIFYPTHEIVGRGVLP
jgi:hypothetical protein